MRSVFRWSIDSMRAVVMSSRDYLHNSRMWRVALLGVALTLFAGGEWLDRFARACVVGADLRVCPGSGLHATAGAETQVCPYIDLQNALTYLASPDKPLPDGPGKAETQKLCSQCHDMDKSVSLRQDRVGWRRTIEKMLAFGAKATDHEFNAVLDYLATNFPADDVPK